MTEQLPSINESINISTREAIDQKLKLLPDQPGCYLMKNAEGDILYVGKAKNLKNRVRSYFRGAHDTKTTKLVSEIDHFETIITNNNKEALLLEINLIQQYKPPYNIKLKEGTMYPYIKITKERHPQLIIANQVVKDGGYYFGPFPNVGAATQTQQLLQRVYPLRRCGKNEKRACFYYHLGQCIGCCDHEVPKEVYQQQIERIRHFFNGDIQEVIQILQHKMEQAAEKLEFEQAADYRDQLDYIATTIERQMIMSHDYDKTDVFGYTFKRGWIAIQVFMLRQGSILKHETAIYPCYTDPEEEMTTFIARFYNEESHLLPKIIFVPEQIEADVLQEVLDVQVVTPQRGKKRSMLELCQKNSEQALNQQLDLLDMQAQQTTGVSEDLATLLSIPLAYHIEAFDHSNISSTNMVSGMVVYRNGKPSRKEYRKFKIKDSQHTDEYAHSYEVIYRRYHRLLREEQPLPHLILMDGGKIQVRAAKAALKTLGITIPVAGMVKDDTHKTAHLLNGDTEKIVDIDRKRPVFHYLQRIQEEVHRYAISYHRQVRSKSQFGSILDQIDGVGKVTRTKLLKHFQSIKHIQAATVEDLQQLGIPIKVAENILSTLNQT